MRYLFSLTLCLGSLMFLGCGETEKTDSAAKSSDAEVPQKEVHDHPDEGPHKGKLIELGDEEYHGELLIDKETGTVTIYVLDSTAGKNVPIDAEEVRISEGSESYSLAAKPLEGEPPGQSSRFEIENKALSALLSGHVHARLLLKISGKSFNGSIDSH